MNKLKLISSDHDLPITTDVSSLTKSEMRLLYVLCDPDASDCTVKEITDKANCSRETYYRAMAKPIFVDAQKQIATAIVKQHLISLINVGVKNAKKGSFQHWAKLMEIAGMVTKDGEGATGDITIRFADPRAPIVDITPSE